MTSRLDLNKDVIDGIPHPDLQLICNWLEVEGWNAIVKYCC